MIQIGKYKIRNYNKELPNVVWIENEYGKEVAFFGSDFEEEFSELFNQ